ncbi:MAG: hypothetical protein ACHP7K_07495, partial [Actinomycetales bacterium]
MPASVDVGSVLGGRYKVTAHVLESAEQDSVLEGVDQVLNRPVSILVAGPDNAGHLTQGAREVATGERHAALQILDLGTSEGTTYLITNQSPAPDLLDLLVPTEPYVEPFFTDTLGQEIFGQARPDVPAAHQYDYVYEDDSPVELDGSIRPPAGRPAQDVPDPRRPAAAAERRQPASPAPSTAITPAAAAATAAAA